MTLKKSEEHDYEFVVKRDGEYCKLCGAISAEKKLVIANTVDADPNKKILLCKECLIQKKLYELCVSEREKVKEDVGFVTELQVNRQKEMRFRLYVYEKLSEIKNTKWEERDLNNSAAEVIGISPTTARRYLDKMCSSEGVLVRNDDGENVYITFNLNGWGCQ